MEWESRKKNLRTFRDYVLTKSNATGKGKRNPDTMDKKMDPGMANVCRKR